MRCTNIVFLLFPNTHLIDLTGPAQVFYEANCFGKEIFHLHFASVNKTVASRQGLTLANLIHFEHLTLQKGDFVCIPGVDFQYFCEGRLNQSITETKKWLKTQLSKGVHLGSICSGALILAKMGLLNSVQCTTHWKCLPFAKKQYPRAHFRDDRLYIFDKGIFTSAGMSSGIDMALALVEKWCSPLLAAQIAHEMVINIRRVETKSQENTFLDFKNHFNATVYKAQQILADRLDASFTLNDLSKELNMGIRQLERLFKSHTQNTIQVYRNTMRFEHGEKLLYNTELSVKEIAFKCGYESTRQFARLWKNRTGLTPLHSRRAFSSDKSASANLAGAE